MHLRLLDQEQLRSLKFVVQDNAKSFPNSGTVRFNQELVNI